MREGPLCDDEKNTPLHAACASGSTHCVKLIYEKIDKGIRRSSNDGAVVVKKRTHIWDTPNAKLLYLRM